MKLNHLMTAAMLALAATGASAAMPNCTATTNWKQLGTPDTQLFFNYFGSTGQYTDCYSFTVASSANVFGGALELDAPALGGLDLQIKSISLYGNGGLLGSFAGTSAPLEWFSFGNLAGETAYTLAVSSSVTGSRHAWVGAGYAGGIQTIAAPVPEPGALALMAAGLLGVGALASRKRRS